MCRYGRFLVDASPLLCVIQSRLHLPFTTHYEVHIFQLPKILILRMTATEFVETSDNFQRRSDAMGHILYAGVKYATVAVA
jgi:hypothetical protein